MDSEGVVDKLKAELYVNADLVSNVIVGLLLKPVELYVRVPLSYTILIAEPLLSFHRATLEPLVTTLAESAASNHNDNPENLDGLKDGASEYTCDGRTKLGINGL